VKLPFSLASLLSTALLMAGCRDEPMPAIQVTLGSGREQTVTFVPRSTYAEYVSLPTSGNELRITLTSNPTSCENFTPVPEGQWQVTVVTITPEGQVPGVETYPWVGHEAHGGTPAKPKLAYTMPHVRFGSRGYPLPPGGNLELTQVSLGRHGMVKGLLRFEQPGAAGQPATRLFGSFLAHVCRTTVDMPSEAH